MPLSQTVGAAIVDGIPEALITTTGESSLCPCLFTATTLKSYENP